MPQYFHYNAYLLHTVMSSFCNLIDTNVKLFTIKNCDQYDIVLLKFVRQIWLKTDKANCHTITRGWGTRPSLSNCMGTQHSQGRGQQGSTQARKNGIGGDIYPRVQPMPNMPCCQPNHKMSCEQHTTENSLAFCLNNWLIIYSCTSLVELRKTWSNVTRPQVISSNK